jgi:hypothetical protein
MFKRFLSSVHDSPSDYEFQLALQGRCVGDKDKPLTLEEIRDELNL